MAVRKLDGSYGTVERVTVEQRTQPMYNLTVAVAHTFFVGDDGWLVHNVGKCRLPQISNISNPAARRYAERISNAIEDHLTPLDLEGAWRDLHGNPVPKPGVPGEFYDHYGEVNSAVRSLRNSIDEFKELLTDPRVSDVDKLIIQQYLGSASNTVDYVEKVITRDTWYPGAEVPYYK